MELSAFVMLDVLIGFVAVMFLLSLLVMAGAQVTQAVFRRRMWNLRDGLEVLLQTADLPERHVAPLLDRVMTMPAYRKPLGPVTALVAGGARTEISYEEFIEQLARYVAGEQNSTDEAGTDVLRQWWDRRIEAAHDAWMEELLERVAATGKRPTPEELEQLKLRPKKALEIAQSAVSHASEDFLAPISRSQFHRMEEESSGRFGVTMKAMSTIWAVVITLLFQLNAIQLVRDLSTDQALRARAAGVALQLEENGDQRIEKAVFPDIVEIALEDLAEAHPDVAERLEEVSGVGATQARVRSEIRQVLRDQPDLETILESWDEIVRDLRFSEAKESAKLTRDQLDELARLNITVASSLGEWMEPLWERPLYTFIGLLATALLLTLGAPFWFEQLRNLGNVRDTFADFRKQPQARNRRQDRTADGADAD